MQKSVYDAATGVAKMVDLTPEESVEYEAAMAAQAEAQTTALGDAILAGASNG